MAQSGKILTIQATELEVGDIMVVNGRDERVTEIRGCVTLKIFTAEGGRYTCENTVYVNIRNV